MARTVKTPGQSVDASEVKQPEQTEQVVEQVQAQPESTEQQTEQSADTPVDDSLLLELLAKVTSLENKLDLLLSNSGVQEKAKPGRFKFVPGKGHVYE